MLASLGIIAVVLSMVSLVLYFVESFLGVPEVAYTWGVALPAVVFFVYALCAIGIFQILLKKMSRLVLTFHMFNNIVRIVLAALLIFLYGYFIGEGILVYAINLLVFYLLIVIMVSRALLRADRLV